MKFKSDIDFTYMGCLHNAWYANDRTEEQEVLSLLQQFKQLTHINTPFMPAFFVVDYATKGYLTWTDGVKSLTGYDARDIIAGGLGFTLDKSNKDFLKTLNHKIFPSTVSHLQNIPRHEQPNHLFSFNHQIQKANGQWLNYLQRGIYITSKETNLPLYCIGMSVDISAYKKDRTMLLTVEKIDKTTNSLSFIDQNCFYLNEDEAQLTNQEKNIVKYIVDGLSSKMIANKLHLSENTIANHRKNMLRKTNTKNVAQLIGFVIRNKII